MCVYVYRIAGNFCEVKISHFLRFDPIRKSLLAKSLILMHKRELSKRRSRNVCLSAKS